MLNILIACDKFKGSLTATEVCDTVATGFCEQDQSLSIVKIPLADGGEGTCDLLTSLEGGEVVSLRVRDPLFREIESYYGISKDRSTAFIEVSLASGLQLLRKEERDPRITSTIGTGELIKHALDSGVDNITLGIGGSATNDAGMGVAQALGVKFLSEQGELLAPVGKNLKFVHTIDLTQLHVRCADVKMIILCDVDNPLYGKRGAAFTFARQKGADPKTIEQLDEGLEYFGTLLKRDFNVDIDFKGAGAAGGIAVMMQAIMQTSIQSGISYIIAQTKLEDAIKNSDAVITGEGKLDTQSLDGKVISGVTALCKKYQKPVFVVAGQNTLHAEELSTAGIERCFSVMDEVDDASVAMENTSELLRKIAGNRILPILSGL